MLKRNESILQKNINSISERIELLEKQRALIVKDFDNNVLSSHQDISLEERYSTFKQALPNACFEEKFAFCSSLGKSFSPIYNATDNYIPVTPGSHGKIAFIRNNYNDMALKKFSSVIPHSKSVQKSSFEECCEAVSAGECEFTVLPIENTSDGKMFGFYSLIDRSELHICAVCNIDSDDISKTIRYALVGRNFTSEQIEKLCSKNKRFFEFSLLIDNQSDIVEIVRAISACSASVSKISSLSMPYDNDLTKLYFSCVISKETDVLTLSHYLKLEYPQHDLIGIYREL